MDHALQLMVVRSPFVNWLPVKRHFVLFKMQASNGLGDVYWVVTQPDLSGPMPTRRPPPKAASTPSTPVGAVSRSFSLQSTPSQRVDVYDEIDDFEDDEELPQKSNRALNDISNFMLDLPPFATGKVVISF